VISPDWMADAACKDMHPNDFLPPRGVGGHAILKRLRAICAGCPVRAECLDYALELGDQGAQGCWAGTTEAERRVLRRRRRAA
jgi:WhiB family redox-sensing transcriptional regulator